jgi:hypothetical protein
MHRFILHLLLLGLDHEERTNRQHIHASALETINGFLWCADDGLVLVEARIQDYGDPRFESEAWIGFVNDPYCHRRKPRRRLRKSVPTLPASSGESLSSGSWLSLVCLDVDTRQ